MKPLLALLAVLVTASAALAQPAPKYADRWVYLGCNLQVDASADEAIRVVERAAKSGYTGIVLSDFKLSILEHVTQNWFKNAERLKKAAAAAKIEIIPLVFPIGWSSGILFQDPNLAEGVPVKDAPFVVKDGTAVLIPTDTGFTNGDFEAANGDKFTGFGFHDEPGKFTFADHQVFASGKQSMRMQNPTANCRVMQRVKLRPWSCYRLTAKVKTKDFRDGEFKFLAIGNTERSLTAHQTTPQATQDWTEVEVAFNSFDSTEANIYAGVWDGFKGTLWLDDWKLEEVSLVNVLRRSGCPLVVKRADDTVFTEGKDFLPVKDEKLGVNEEGRGNYDFRHAGPQIRLTLQSRIKNGDRLLVSWYHPLIIYGEQVTCSLSEPKLFDLLTDQARRVNAVFKPKTWFMSHDEIRVAGWDKLGEGRTPGQLLAENVRRCVGIIRKLSPNARIVVWSDMFDPHHNATDKFVLVNGSLKGSWEGLPKDVIIANWNSGKAGESLKFFADRGHKQILAGYYDSDIGNFRKWDAAAKGVPNVAGFMYTTWHRKYDLLEEYGKAMLGK